MMFGNPNNPMYWPTLVVKLMQRIPPAPPINPLKQDKLVDGVVKCNLKTYGGSYDPVELEERIRGMEKIFAVIKVPEKKKVSTGTFYPTGEANIWWNIVKDGLTGPKLTWSKFLEELRAKLYPIMVQ